MAAQSSSNNSGSQAEHKFGEYWIVLDDQGRRKRVLPTRAPYAELRVELILTADERFTLVEETTTWKEPRGAKGEKTAISPPEDGWQLVEERGDLLRWRRRNTIPLRKRDVAELMRVHKRLRASAEGQL